MKDNLSIVITIIVLVLLMVIFPLYNFFERQDDMSYNLVLKATTNFVDQVMNNGYIDQNMYDKFVTELANTGNVYDIEIETHRKVLTGTNNVYQEQSYIDYTNDIFTEMENTSGTSNLMKKSLKNNIYLLNAKDEIYVKVKNSNTTMAGALFNVIVPTSSKTRIEVNYGGIVKNNAWKYVDATYTGHNIAPGAPEIKIQTNVIDNNENEYYQISKNDIIDFGITAKATPFEGREISKYFWKITDIQDSTKVKDRMETSEKLQDITEFLEENHKYKFEVYVVDNAGYKSDSTIVKVEIVTSGGTPEVTDIAGDVNNDGVLNNEDLTLFDNFINASITPTESQMEKADFNNDKKITERDKGYFVELRDYGYILGDINYNNDVDIMDSTLLSGYISNNVSFNSELFKRADMNKDNKIDSNDVTLIQEKSLKK